MLPSSSDDAGTARPCIVKASRSTQSTSGPAIERRHGYAQRRLREPINRQQRFPPEAVLPETLDKALQRFRIDGSRAIHRRAPGAKVNPFHRLNRKSCARTIRRQNSARRRSYLCVLLNACSQRSGRVRKARGDITTTGRPWRNRVSHAPIIPCRDRAATSLRRRLPAPSAPLPQERAYSPERFAWGQHHTLRIARGTRSVLQQRDVAALAALRLARQERGQGAGAGGGSFSAASSNFRASTTPSSDFTRGFSSLATASARAKRQQQAHSRVVQNSRLPLCVLLDAVRAVRRVDGHRNGARQQKWRCNK